MNNIMIMAAEKAEALLAITQAIVHLEDAENINGDLETPAIKVVKNLIFLYEEEAERLNNTDALTACVKTMSRDNIERLIEIDEKAREARALAKTMGDISLNLCSMETRETFFNLAYLLLDATKTISKSLAELAIG